MRKKHAAAHENHERWLVSYADFITLLFAFFVVMFASTQSDKQKAKAVSDSVKEALEHGQFSSAVSVVLGRGKHENSKPPVNPDRVPKSENLPSKPEQHAADLGKSLETLKQGLAGELKSGKVQLRLEGRGLVITLREAAFYASGDDAVSSHSRETIGRIAEVLRDIPEHLRIEGYTDSVPIHNARFRDNWQLSAARAIAMLGVLSNFGIGEDRMMVAGYAENAPVDTNDTEEGRAHNRRVDLVVMSLDAMKGEPARAAAATPATPPSAAPAPAAAAPPPGRR